MKRVKRNKMEIRRRATASQYRNTLMRGLPPKGAKPVQSH